MTAQLKSTIVALALMLAVCLLFPSAALAQGTNCPPEPVQGTPIYDGEIYIGANCTLTSPGDVDGFVFSGANGETYHIVLAINGSSTTDICMKLYNPSAMVIFSGCTDIAGNRRYVADNQALTVTGTYTIDISENSTDTVSYALSLERLYPFPPNAQEINLATPYNGDITPITDSNAFTFGGETTGTEQVSATLTGSPHSDLCMDVYLQDGTDVGEECTDIAGNRFTIQISFTPTQNGTSMAFFQVEGNDGTDTYTVEVSCIVGTCGTSSIPDVAGYLILRGTPLAGVGVSLSQPGSPFPQLTRTDNNGYYQFLHIISGQAFNILIHAPTNLSDPASADAASPDTVDKDPLK